MVKTRTAYFNCVDCGSVIRKTLRYDEKGDLFSPTKKKNSTCKKCGNKSYYDVADAVFNISELKKVSSSVEDDWNSVIKNDSHLEGSSGETNSSKPTDEIKVFSASPVFNDESNDELNSEGEQFLNSLKDFKEEKPLKTASKPKTVFNKNTEEVGFDYAVLSPLYVETSKSIAKGLNYPSFAIGTKEANACSKSLTSVLNRRLNTENGDIWTAVITHALVFIPRGIGAFVKASKNRKPKVTAPVYVEEPVETFVDDEVLEANENRSSVKDIMRNNKLNAGVIFGK